MVWVGDSTGEGGARRQRGSRTRSRRRSGPHMVPESGGYLYCRRDPVIEYHKKTKGPSVMPGPFVLSLVATALQRGEGGKLGEELVMVDVPKKANAFGGKIHAPKKAKLSEGSRADCAAIERTSEAKWPQGTARKPNPKGAQASTRVDPNAPPVRFPSVGSPSALRNRRPSWHVWVRPSLTEARPSPVRQKSVGKPVRRPWSVRQMSA